MHARESFAPEGHRSLSFVSTLKLHDQHRPPMENCCAGCVSRRNRNAASSAAMRRTDFGSRWNPPPAPRSIVDRTNVRAASLGSGNRTSRSQEEAIHASIVGDSSPCGSGIRFEAKSSCRDAKMYATRISCEALPRSSHSADTPKCSDANVGSTSSIQSCILHSVVATYVRTSPRRHDADGVSPVRSVTARGSNRYRSFPTSAK